MRLKKIITVMRKGGTFTAGLVLFVSLAGANAHGQDSSIAQRVTLGQVSGSDVTVTGPSSGTAEATQSGSLNVYSVVDGSTIVVHSGKARLDFAGGGEADICGPAKLAVLNSGEALTIAVSFGRVHVKVDALRPITIYTPTILATPISIQEQPREMTLGMANSGAMCVAATHGAVQVQQQLSGEMLVIPEPSEVELRDSPFGAAPATTGSCTCDSEGPGAQRETTPPITAAQSEPPANAPKASASSVSDKMPAETVGPAPTKTSVAAASKPAPQRPSERREVTTYTSTNPTLKAVYPRIGDDMESATISAVPLSVATLMLAKEADVETGWTFQGTVIGPPQDVKQTAQAQSATHTQRKRGFWSRLRVFLFGSKS